MSQYTNTYSVFICYRRKEEGGAPLGSYIARIIYEKLVNSGISTFYDVECFKTGEDYKELTPQIITDQIRFFIIILTPDIFNRCKSKEKDAVYREIRCAIKKYNSEKKKVEILPINKFKFVPVNPDNLFDFNLKLLDCDLPGITERVSSNTASEISFSKKAFNDDIRRELIDPITETLSINTLDSINNAPNIKKSEILPIQPQSVGLLSSIYKHFVK